MQVRAPCREAAQNAHAVLLDTEPQWPLQQSELVWQVWPTSMQQVPPLQVPRQQSPGCEQCAPKPNLPGAQHEPAPHTPLQQSWSRRQPASAGWQQMPPPPSTPHWPSQHSALVRQGAPRLWSWALQHTPDALHAPSQQAAAPRGPQKPPLAVHALPEVDPAPPPVAPLEVDVECDVALHAPRTSVKASVRRTDMALHSRTLRGAEDSPFERGATARSR
jgi:hypothetical protein